MNEHYFVKLRFFLSLICHTINDPGTWTPSRVQFLCLGCTEATEDYLF